MPHPEFNYQAAIFTLTAQTNMHVGSGSQSYGIIDNLIQRDPLTSFPCIYSSSLKGALREYFCHYLNTANKNFITHVFGSEREAVTENNEPANGQKTVADNNKPEPQQSGKFRFMQAELLSIPVRSDQRLFYRATCPYLTQLFGDTIRLYKAKDTHDSVKAVVALNSTVVQNKKAVQFETDNAIAKSILEETDIIAERVNPPHNFKLTEAILGDGLALVNDLDFVELVSDFHLPVIARNNLTDGRSTNLWYEQVLPRETKFWFAVLYPVAETKLIEDFIDLVANANPVQVGANASIGYGFCKINYLSEISSLPNTALPQQV